MGDLVAAAGRGVAAGTTCGGLTDESRLRALSELGLGARPDPQMEAFVERVRRRLGVPLAVVSLVYPDEQVFPGMAGLSEPWASRRSTPLTHSFCQHVVLTAREWVIPDAAAHPVVGESVALDDLGGIGAYAGMPLIDDAGNVLGALAAADTRRRSWTAEDLDHLRELAEACSTQLRLRLSRFTAEVERSRRDELEDRLRRSFERSQALLEAAQSFNGAVSVEDVRRRVGELVGIALRPSHVGLVLTDGEGRLTRSREGRFPTGPAADPWWASLELTAHVPSAVAVRERRLVVHEDRASFDVAYDERAGTMLREIGLHAVVAAPLLGADGALGALVFGWAGERSFTPSDLLILTTVTGYAAHALGRAQRLQHRSAVATQMQRAMLTTLPEIEGLAVAARYVPGDAREQVGGDWYDLVPLLDTPADDLRPRPRRDGDRSGFALSVGDILGHDVAAATVMGQVRSMLRQASWDHPRRPPSAVLTAFENACADLSVPARGTAVIAHLRPGLTARWCMTWTNAGHPFPVLLAPGEAPVVLEGHDTLFGFSHARSRPRHDHQRELPPGSVVVLYTDGLVEGRGLDLDTGMARFLALLDDHRGAPPRLLVDTCGEELASGASDDTVALAFQVPPDQP